MRRFRKLYNDIVDDWVETRSSKRPLARNEVGGLLAS
jgi:hypothetical protein